MKKRFVRIVLCLSMSLILVFGLNIVCFAGNASNSGWVGNYSFSAAANISSTYLSSSLGSNTADVRIQGNVYSYNSYSAQSRYVYSRSLDYYVSLQTGLSTNEDRFSKAVLQYYVNNTYATQLTAVV